MKLANASKYFDKEPVYDAYTGDFLFKCQFSSFDDSTSSGATSRRRVLSTAAGLSLPARKVVTIFGDPWIGGDSNTDGFMGNPVRGNFNLKKAVGLFNILTPAEACTSAAGVSAYAATAYFKDNLDTVTTSEYDIFWNIFFSTTETINKGSFIRNGSTLYRVRATYTTDDKYHLAESDELDPNSLKTLTFTSVGTYNTVTDTYDSISTAVPGICLDIPKFYKLRDKAEEREAPGDQAVFVAKSAVTPKVNATFMMDSRLWKVIAVVDELDAWALHVRRT